MKLIIALLLIASPVFAQEDELDRLEQSVQSHDYRIQNLERDVSGIKQKLSTSPVVQKGIEAPPEQFPKMVPKKLIPPGPDTADGCWLMGYDGKWEWHPTPRTSSGTPSDPEAFRRACENSRTKDPEPHMQGH